MQAALEAVTGRLFQPQIASGGVMSICALITTLQDMWRAACRQEETSECLFVPRFPPKTPRFVTSLIVLRSTFTLDCVCLVSD